MARFVTLNIPFVLRQLSKLLAVIALAMAAVSVWSFVEWLGLRGGDDAATIEAATREIEAMRAIWITILASGVISGVLRILSRGADDAFLGRREALLLVALSWIIGAAVAALPFFFWAQFHDNISDDHPFRSFIACYFESMSGLTTTGATVLGAAPNDIESMPNGLLLWRATTHWLGGLGIVVLFVAVLPMVGVGGKKLFAVEATGPTTGGVRPRIRETARMLWMIYVGMTIAEILLLKIVAWNNMTWFESVCHTFATLATGGFSTSSSSAAHFDSVAVDIVMMFFMLLAGINFGLYYHLIRRQFRTFLQDRELRLYLTFLAIGSAIVVFDIYGTKIMTTGGKHIETGTLAHALQYGVFQVISIQTTTGFGTADFNEWGFLSKTVLITLMFVGGCAGSTGGGIKVIRILVVFKVMLAEVERMFRPNVVRPVKIGQASIEPEQRLGIMVYVMGILVLFAIGTFLIFALEQGNPHKGPEVTLVTAATASAATLNNIGPGLELVGATQNYGWFSQTSLAIMCVLMALGRLEVYAIFVLFVPRFWKGE